MDSINKNLNVTPAKLNWLRDAIVPVMLVMGMWPLYALLVDKPYSFLNALCSGDLLAISFTLLISSLTEYTSKAWMCTTDEAETKISMLQLLSTCLMVFFAFGYAALKIYAQQNYIPEVESPHLNHRLYLTAIFSIFGCLLSLGFIYYGKSCLEFYKL